MPSINISDKDMTNVVLSQYKYQVSSLTNLILESANQSLRNDVTNMLQTTFTHQKQIFDLMSQKGWYQVQTASNQDIVNAQETVTNMQVSTTI